MRVVWTLDAELDRLAIVEFIAADNPSAAVAMDERFERAAERLGRLPFLGRVGLIDGTRELFPHSSYRLVYEIHQETVWVLALIHTARRWPSDEEP